jgi:hypothetical protein
MRTTFLIAAVGVSLMFGVLAAAAPGVKEKEPEDKPETEEMYVQTTNNLKRLGLGVHNYENNYGRLPGNVMKDGKPLLSWRVQVLPFLLDEGNKLFDEFKLDEPWDSEHNKKLIVKMPKIYTPLRGKAKAGETFYQSFQGENTALITGGGKFAQFTDGLTPTFLVTEADKAIIWTKPDDIEFDGKNAPKLGGMFKDSFFVLFADGHVQKVPKNVDGAAIVAAITRNGGEVSDIDAAIEAAQKE